MKTAHGVQVLTTIDELTNAAQTAMIVIDMQNDDVSLQGGAATAGTDTSNHRAIVPSIQKLLEAARRVGVLIVYVEFVHLNADGVSLMDGPSLYVHRNDDFVSLLRPGTWAAQTVDELAPQPGDLVFPKSRASAFRGTPLNAHLRTHGVRSLVLTGIATSGCVLHTHSDALMEGYYPVVVSDAVATSDDEKHRTALDWMSRRAPAFNTEEVLEVWDRVAVATGVRHP